MSRVLLVNDHDHIRRDLRLLLEDLGHVVEEADDGLDGVSKALSWKPDTAIVGIAMPIIDGYAFARRMRETFGTGIRLIALIDSGQHARASEAGFDLFLPESAGLDAEGTLFAARDALAAVLPGGAAVLNASFASFNPAHPGPADRCARSASG
jgi:CheY-like chemotaxis protein